MAAIQALASKSLLEMLAEPTVPAINGKPASFVAGGEFPFPMVQPGSNGSSSVITISWREYGIRLNFLPIITPRGTIRLQVAPEVSSLDYTHAVTVAGTTVPALSTRRVSTEIELQSGQSFVIAGLLDNQTTDNFSKIPGIGDIPILGKLFQSKTISRTNSELLVIVTPEIVRPIPEGQPVPDLNYPQTFLPNNTTASPLHHPGMSTTGAVPVTPPTHTVPLEQLVQQPLQGTPAAAPNPAATSVPQAGPAAQCACTRCPPADGPPRPTAAPPAAAPKETKNDRAVRRTGMYPLTIGLAIENQDLMQQARACLADLPFRVTVEHQDIRDRGGFLDRLERMRPDVVLVDISNCREPLEGLVASIRTAAGDPMIVALNTVAESDAILTALRAGINEYVYPPLAEPLRKALKSAPPNAAGAAMADQGRRQGLRLFLRQRRLRRHHPHLPRSRGVGTAGAEGSAGGSRSGCRHDRIHYQD